MGRVKGEVKVKVKECGREGRRRSGKEVVLLLDVGRFGSGVGVGLI